MACKPLSPNIPLDIFHGTIRTDDLAMTVTSTPRTAYPTRKFAIVLDWHYSGEIARLKLPCGDCRQMSWGNYMNGNCPGGSYPETSRVVNVVKEIFKLKQGCSRLGMKGQLLPTNVQSKFLSHRFLSKDCLDATCKNSGKYLSISGENIFKSSTSLSWETYATITTW